MASLKGFQSPRCETLDFGSAEGVSAITPKSLSATGMTGVPATGEADTYGLLASLSLLGPYRLHAGERQQFHFPSLAHWCEAAKVDASCHPDEHTAIILTPTIREARKVATRYQERWRSDWSMIKEAVLSQGLRMLRAQHPNLPLWNQGRVLVNAVVQLTQLNRGSAESAVCRLGLPERRICILNADSAPPQEVGRRLSKLEKTHGTAIHLLAWRGRRSSWEIHDWADRLRVPITYLGAPGGRLRHGDVAAIIATCDHLLLFDEKGHRATEQFTVAAKGEPIAIELALWRGEVDQQAFWKSAGQRDLPRTPGRRRR